MRLNEIILGLIVFSLLSACVVKTPLPQTETALPEKTRPASSRQAVLSLLSRADRAFENGQYDRAAAALQRALRISPRMALLWQRLAKVRLEQGDFHQAEAMAQKSNSVLHNDDTLKLDNWLIISNARRATGDLSGADQAEQRADALVDR